MPIVLYAPVTMPDILLLVVVIAASIIVKAIMIVQATLVIIEVAIRIAIMMPVQSVSMVISINAVFIVDPAIHRQGVVVRLGGRRVIVNCVLWVRWWLHIHRCHACVNIAIKIL